MTKPIEDEIRAVDGVKTTSSTSTSNTSQVEIEWEWGEDTDQIMADIRAAVDEADVPDTVDSTVSSSKFDDLPVLLVGVSSNVSASDLSNQAKDVMVPAIKDVEGVQDVTLAGDEKHEIVITFDIDKANELGIDPTSIGQLFNANVKAYPSGTMRTAPLKSTSRPDAPTSPRNRSRTWKSRARTAACVSGTSPPSRSSRPSPPRCPASTARTR